MYDFRKIGHTQSAQQCEFENIYFKKSQPELLHYIKRKATTAPSASIEGGVIVPRRLRRNDPNKVAKIGDNQNISDRRPCGASLLLSPHLGLSDPSSYISEEELTTDEGEDTPIVDVDEEDTLVPKTLGELLIPTDQVPVESLAKFESTLYRTLSEERKRKRSDATEQPVIDSNESIEISSDLICSTLSNIVNYENEIFGQLKSSYSDSTTANCLSVSIAGDDDELLKKDITPRDVLKLEQYSTSDLDIDLYGVADTLVKGSLPTCTPTQTESDYAETLNLLHRMQYLENSNAETLDQNFSLRDELTITHNRNVKLFHDVGTVIQAINEYIAKRTESNSSSISTSLYSPSSSFSSRSSSSYNNLLPTMPFSTTLSPNSLLAGQVAAQKLEKPPLSPRSPRLVSSTVGGSACTLAEEDMPSFMGAVDHAVATSVTASVSSPLVSNIVPIATMTPTFIFGGEPLTRTVSYGSSALRSVDAGLHRSDSIERWGIPMPPHHT